MSDQDLDLLRAYARECAPGWWTFESEVEEAEHDALGWPRERLTPVQALTNIRFCLAMDAPVSSRLSSDTMLKIATRLAALEARVTNLEGPLGRLA